MKNENWISTFENYVEKVIRESKLPGVAKGLAKNGKVFYERGFGYRNAECQLEVTSDTVFAIGSITKSFTCVALMQLREKGWLSLHDPVKKYLPELSLKDDKYTDQMTIHHFMTHTSGIPDLKSFPVALYHSLTEDDFKNDPLVQGKKSDFEPVQTYKEYLDYIAQRDFQLLGKPGEHWSYNNDCYGLLAAITERVSGQTYEDYITDHILGLQRCSRHLFILKT